MAAQTLPTTAETSAPGASRCCPEACATRAMTRCECAGESFVEIARQVHVEGRSLTEVLRGSGCGQTCGACLPDLRAFLSARP